MMRRRGFTLLETLAVVVGLSLVLTAVISTYVAIQNQSLAATLHTEPSRRATAFIDRMVQELSETSLLVKPEDIDPIEHPWLFLAEQHLAQEGSDRIRFQTRSHKARGSKTHASDLVDIAYWLAPAQQGQGYDLLRWTSLQLPESLDRSFPHRDDANVSVWARSIASFGIRWQDENGEWANEWDSSTLTRSSQLPVVGEIRVAFVDPQADPTRPNSSGETLSRKFRLPLRPIDLVAESNATNQDANDAGSADRQPEASAAGRSSNPSDPRNALPMNSNPPGTDSFQDYLEHLRYGEQDG